MKVISPCFILPVLILPVLFCSLFVFIVSFLQPIAAGPIQTIELFMELQNTSSNYIALNDEVQPRPQPANNQVSAALYQQYSANQGNAWQSQQSDQPPQGNQTYNQYQNQPYQNNSYQNQSQQNNYLYSSTPPADKRNANDTLAHLHNGLYGQARTSFIMKVYLTLTVQLVLTCAMCFVSYFVPAYLNFQVENQWLMWVLFALILVVEIAIFCVPAAHRFPINMILLLIFTLGYAYIISYACSIVAQESGSQVVVVAAVMTLTITFALTMYAIFTPTDFSTKGGFLVVLLAAMLMLGIISIFAWSPFLEALYCTLGVIVYGMYIVVDTQLIIGGRKNQLPVDDYVVAALILYIDIIGLFLTLLEILSKKK